MASTCAENIGLAMRRLSIIDLQTGQQPVTNEDGTVWIVFNGEIYNHQELRQQLEPRGHRYRSRSDTETIVHLYEEYGRECVKHLRGMFAFAIWDSSHAIPFRGPRPVRHQAFLLPVHSRDFSIRFRDQGHPGISWGARGIQSQRPAGVSRLWLPRRS